MKSTKFKQRLYYLAIISVLAVISFLSPGCEIIDNVKEDIGNYEVSLDELTEVAQTESDLNLAYFDVLNVTTRAGSFLDNSINSLQKKSTLEEILGGSMTLKFVGTAENPFPVYVEADWGETNRPGSDGKNRRGGMKLVFDGLWGTAGSSVNIYFGLSTGDQVLRDAFYLDDNKIEGILTITNNGDNSYTMIVTQGVFTYSDGRVATRESEIALSWFEGFETKMDISDDAWLMFGGVDGVTPSGVPYSIVVDPNKAIKKNAECEFPVSGETQISIKKIKFDLDYSFDNEQCDSKAVVDFFGINHTIDFLG